ncbi:MAG TPA: carbon monoxide dehydrogenase, partial [Desulfosporosinus sp.]|nr:carbon monoxide dehydrogenase [Desulfosporosinus sp.]
MEQTSKEKSHSTLTLSINGDTHLFALGEGCH